MIGFTSSGSFAKTEAFLRKMVGLNISSILNAYGEKGRAALAAATPVDTGLTAESWTYTVTRERGGWTISWSNHNKESGAPVAILLQYGHGTGTGGYIQGRDYINPVVQPLFDQIAADVWKVVTSS